MDNTFSQSVQYKIDNFLARGSGPLFIALTVVFVGSLALLVVMRMILNLAAPGFEASVVDHTWTVFLELTDPGSMGEDTETPGVFKVGAVAAGIVGVTIFSALIAFLTTGLEELIANLKKGHSRVLEVGHTIVLGWGPRVPEVLRELVEANESEKNPCVVILAEEDKEMMDEYLLTNFPDNRNTRIVTRTGSTSSLASLKKVSAKQAKSAIVLSTSEAATEKEKLDSDASVIKTVLALITFVGEENQLNIVGEVYNERNQHVVRQISHRITVIDAQEILAKIMVQTSRTSGLAVVYSELLSFDGCELYFYEANWNSATFGQAQFHFPDGVPIGIRNGNGLTIRPPQDKVLGTGDEILIVAEDDSTIDFRPNPIIQPQSLPLHDARTEPKEERQLILGWSRKASIIISEYADYVLEGSVVDVVIADPPPYVVKEIAALDDATPGLKISHIDRDPLNVEELEAIEPFTYDNVIILPQQVSSDVDPGRVDSETIIVLLHLRHLMGQLERPSNTKLITEVLDSANQELITRAGVDDFIISNRMVSMFLAQISEEPRIKVVYDDLFQEEGSEIYVKPAMLYFEQLPVTCRFGDLLAHTQKRDGEICIGYKLKAQENDPEANFGVKLIPPKDAQITLREGDAVVVVSEDDR